MSRMLSNAAHQGTRACVIGLVDRCALHVPPTTAAIRRWYWKSCHSVVGLACGDVMSAHMSANTHHSATWRYRLVLEGRGGKWGLLLSVLERFSTTKADRCAFSRALNSDIRSGQACSTVSRWASSLLRSSTRTGRSGSDVTEANRGGREGGEWNVGGDGGEGRGSVRNEEDLPRFHPTAQSFITNGTGKRIRRCCARGRRKRVMGRK